MFSKLKIKKANLYLILLAMAGIILYPANFAYAANNPPVVGTITPSSGASKPDKIVIFTATYTDPDGWQNIKNAYFQVNRLPDGKNCFFARYDQNTNKLYLRNNANTAWLPRGGYTPGTKKVIQNSYAKLNCFKTTVPDGGTGKVLKIRWAVRFKPAFAGNKNTYLKVIDDANAQTGWVKKGTWTIVHILSISVDPKLWDIGPTNINNVITMARVDKITTTNDGTGPETFELKLVNPQTWTASNNPGPETYVLNGIFCGTTDIPGQTSFSQDDVITTEPKKATETIFAYEQGTANGISVPSGNARSMYLQFKSPTITQKKDQQSISVTITAQNP